MYPLRSLLLAALFGASSAAAAAVPVPAPAAAAPTAPSSTTRNPISVHVLDLQTGLPSADVAVVLEKKQGERWVLVGEARTNADGRIDALYPVGAALESNDYRLTFQTGAWFAQRNIPSFYPVVQVVVHLDGATPHYHVPLLLSPYGYSTYRGS